MDEVEVVELQGSQAVSEAFRERMGRSKNEFLATVGDHGVWRDRWQLIVRHPKAGSGKRACYRNANRETYFSQARNVLLELVDCCKVKLSAKEQSALLERLDGNGRR